MTDHAFVSANAISRAVNVGWVLLASTTAIIGALCLITGDFAYNWQPVPENLPQRALLARLTGLLFIAVGLLCFLPRLRNFGINALVVIFWAWLLVFHIPALFKDGWLGAAEFLLPATAGIALLWLRSDGRSRFFDRQTFIFARIGFGIGLIGCGASHFIYAEPASQMIPDWFPARLFFTYLTGAGHIAAGLSLISGIAMRTATPLLCFMFASFVCLLHVPRVLVDPGNRFEWTMLVVSVLLNGAAWVMAAAVFYVSRRLQR